MEINDIMKKIIVIFTFSIYCFTSFGQAWVQDEIAEESEGSPFNGIIGAILVFVFIWLMAKLFGGKKKDETQNKSYFHYKETENVANTSTQTINKLTQEKADVIIPYKNAEKTNIKEENDLVKNSNPEEYHIQGGIKIISKKTFAGASGFKFVLIPNSVVEVEDFAFSSQMIEEIKIPNSILKWGESVFFECNNLRNVSIEEGLKGLSMRMFMCCNNLKNVIIPSTIQYLPDMIFYDCRSLEQIILPSNIHGIGNNAFYQCEKLQNIELPTSLIGLSDSTFEGCSSLSYVGIPEGLVVISSRCFSRCYNLKAIKIPTTLQYIDIDAFSDCSNITLKVPAGSSSFYWDMELEGVSNIIEYESNIINNITELKKKAETFISIQKYKREQDNFEFRKEIGLITKEEYERENDIFTDMSEEIDDIW